MKLRLNLAGKKYDAEVEFLDEVELAPGGRRSAPSRSGVVLGPAASSPAPVAPASSSNPNAIAAPLAGIIVQVPVQSGAKVKAGDVVVVLEAMKMATNLASPRDGKVKAVLVAKGQNVKQGDLLVELE